MKIENIKIEDIKPYPQNNKKHSKRQIDLVANSIKEFGFNTPLIVDDFNVLIAGHCRLEACKKLGIKEIPVIKKSDLTEAQIKAYRIADNKLTELGEWDLENLDIEIGDLLDLDFPIADFGIEDFRLEPEEIKEKEFDEQELLIIITCENENHQQNLFEDFKKRGLNCKILG